MMRLIILRGYPGSGKTTVGKNLESKGYGVFIDHNAILTFIARYTSDDDGIYEQIAALEEAMTEKLLRDHKSVIVARGFSSSKSVEKYLKIADQAETPSVVLRLNVAVSTLKNRVLSEDRKKDYNPITKPNALVEWIQNNPLQDVPGEKIIDANQGIPSVLQQIEDCLGS